ncbi:MAG: hypothetical protein ACO25F_02225 [Erythrobacter sp.]
MKSVLIPIAAAMLLPLAVTSALAQETMPIQFARGTTASNVSGSIKGDQYIDYRLTVRAGQRMGITLQPTKGSPYFNVLEPGSTDVAVYNSSVNGQRYNGTTAKSGTYTIRVYQMRVTARRGETASYRLSVSVSGSAASESAPAHRPADALVSGTPYHATATIRCRASAGASMASCKAGVVRRNASVTVHIDTPDGGERSIFFREGRAVSSDSDNMMSVKRSRDTSIITIGTYEVYEIPDAFVFGG